MKAFWTLILAACLMLGVGPASLADHKPGHTNGGGDGKATETPMKVQIEPPITSGTDDAVVELDPGCFGVTGINDEGRVAPLGFKKSLKAFTLGSFTAECLWVQVARRREDNAILGVTLNFRTAEPGQECHPSDLSVATDFIQVSGGGVVFGSPSGFQIPIEAQDINVPDRNPFGQVSVVTFWVSPCAAGEDCSPPRCQEERARWGGC